MRRANGVVRRELANARDLRRYLRRFSELYWRRAPARPSEHEDDWAAAYFLWGAPGLSPLDTATDDAAKLMTQPYFTHVDTRASAMRLAVLRWLLWLLSLTVRETWAPASLDDQPPVQPLDTLKQAAPNAPGTWA